MYSHKTDLISALSRLEEALRFAPTDHPLVIDGTLQRFEFCFELCWKTLQEALLEQGIEVNSPKQALIKSYAQGWLKDEQLWLSMLHDRNMSTHTYFLETAEKIYANIPAYYKAIVSVSKRLEQV